MQTWEKHDYVNAPAIGPPVEPPYGGWFLDPYPPLPEVPELDSFTRHAIARTLRDRAIEQQPAKGESDALPV